jgi:hypothetical protein
MAEMPAFPKPHQKENKQTLTPAQRKLKTLAMFRAQGGKCCTCGKWMTMEWGYFNSATFGHDQPQPMGAKKRDNEDNILGAQCLTCQSLRGSKRK